MENWRKKTALTKAYREKREQIYNKKDNAIRRNTRKKKVKSNKG